MCFSWELEMPVFPLLAWFVNSRYLQSVIVFCLILTDRRQLSVCHLEQFHHNLNQESPLWSHLTKYFTSSSWCHLKTELSVDEMTLPQWIFHMWLTTLFQRLESMENFTENLSPSFVPLQRDGENIFSTFGILLSYFFCVTHEMIAAFTGILFKGKHCTLNFGHDFWSPQKYLRSNCTV